MSSRILLHPTKSAPQAPYRVVILPHAGGGAAMYLPWLAEMSSWADASCAVLPGRERLLREEPLRSMEAVTEQLLVELSGDRRPTVLYGHSMGAAIAWNLAHALVDIGCPRPALIVSGAGSPYRRDPEDNIHHLGDRAFIESLRRYGGLPNEIRQSPEMLELVLPGLRSDFTLIETWVPEPREPLDITLTVYSGASDSSVTPYQRQGWDELSALPVDHRVLPGNHFFNTRHQSTIVRAIRDAAERVRNA